MTGLEIMANSVEGFTNSAYFAFFAYFGCSLAISCLWFILERVKEKTKNKKENRDGC
jgi:hypothetical protein